MLVRAERDTVDSGATDGAVHLGSRRWDPPPGSRSLAARLRAALAVRGVIDLVLYGSQARGSTTGFSDVDAVLVVADGAAASSANLRVLRRRVLLAQRHVLAHQPMQHHGFDVATPTLLRHAAAALGLPREAVAHSVSLFGRGAEATFEEIPVVVARDRLARMAREVKSTQTWPRHPWLLHRTISMFELLPALFLQAAGRRIEKWRSFDEARALLMDLWWPYEVLEEARAKWPNAWPHALRTALRAAPNPWVAVDLWRRLPVATAAPIRALLDDRVLHALHVAVARMEVEVAG